MRDDLGVLNNDKNLLGRPCVIVLGDTGCKTSLLPEKLRAQNDAVPWTNASAYKDEPILESHGSYTKLCASEFFRCSQKVKDIEVHAYQCLDRNGSGSNEAIAAALTYVYDKKADVGNFSLGIHAEDEREMRSIIKSMGEINRIGRACYEENGSLICISAGNEDERDDFIGTDIDAPAIFNWAVAVGALTDMGAKTDWSGDGPKLEFVMDGTDIFGIRNESGTSFSCPGVAGLAAYLKTYHFYGNISARDMRMALRLLAVHGGAHPHGPWCPDHGWGSLTPIAKLVLNHVADMRKAAGDPEGISIFA